MPAHVIMPALGVAQQTGTLLKWLKAEGQSVSKGEPLMEIETDKATVEIEAPASGVLAHVIAQAGDEVPVGQRIALILAPGESPETEAKSSEPTPKPNKAKIFAPPAAPKTTPSAASMTPNRGRVLASPAAKRIAQEKGVNLASLQGSGPEGSVLADDVLRASTTELPHRPATPEAEKIPLTPMRRIVGERMTQSKLSAPHFYISMDIDMSAVGALRGEWKSHSDEMVPSINDFILRACARALKDFPLINSTYTEQGIKLSSEINIGMAVALDEGLLVPVIRNTDRLSLIELAAQSRQLADKAENKKLFPLDYEGGTFTVSNLGMLGVDSFTAIINPPQAAILAVGRVAPRVIVEEGMFAIKSMMTATLSADHRLVDGAMAARFLQNVKKLLENPQA
ncbi:MAG: dihydrolipoamide acetyltransferase family protein [Candidatus Binatia bacterium]